MISRRFSIAAIIVSVLLAVGSARGQAMADRVPADALLYAGWAGSDALGGAYDGSHLKAFLNTLNLPQFIAGRVQREIEGGGGDTRAQDAALWGDALAAMAKSPTACYASLDPAAQQPTPHGALFSKVGQATAVALAEKLNAMLNRENAPHAPPHGARAVGDYLLIFVGGDAIAARLQGAAPADNLAANEAFQQTMQQLGPDAGASAVIVYVDAQAALRQLGDAVQNAPGGPAMVMQLRPFLPVIADGAGLTGFKQIAWAGNFDGANWRSCFFMGMREHRNGLVAFFDSPPLSDESMKLIPQSATSAGAIRFDAMRFLQDITDTAAAVSDKAPAQMETMFAQVSAITGIDIKHEFLPSLGDEFMFYGSPEAAGNSLRGFTVFNRLRDPEKAQSALSAVENFANLMILQRNPNSKVQFQTQALPPPWDNVKAHVLTLPNVTPAWAIHDGVLFMSLSLPGLQSALEMTSGKKPSILENPEFVALRKKLGREHFSSFSFADLQKGAPESYEMAGRALANALAGNAQPDQVLTLPPLDKLMPDLGPVLRVSWSDKEGFHSQETAPFPLAGMLSPNGFLGLGLAAQIRQRFGGSQATKAPAVGNKLP